ncbi:MAG: carbon monoxide dehydrogenase subunit G [Nitrososphaerota archaeon]
MRLEGSFEAPAPPQKIWGIITDPRKIGKAIPDLKRLDTKDENNFEAEFKVKLGILSGTMKMDFKYVDLREPSHLTLVGKGSGMQSTVDLKIDLDIVGKGDAGSEVKWVSDISLGGMAASLGSRVIQDLARTKVKELVANLKKITASA